MGKIVLALATALLVVASSEASAFTSFVCQAVGARSVAYGRSFFVVNAKLIALSRCARRSGICTIRYCVPDQPRAYCGPISCEPWCIICGP
jgi:hypothetical protein